MGKNPLSQLLIDHEVAVKLPRYKCISKRKEQDDRRDYSMKNKRSQHEEAIISLGYETGGFPIGKQQLIEIFNQSANDDFYELRERMRKAIQLIEHNNLTMEQVSSSAHICAVIAYKGLSL